MSFVDDEKGTKWIEITENFDAFLEKFNIKL